LDHYLRDRQTSPSEQEKEEADLEQADRTVRSDRTANV
jgi:hypothetical protein